MPPDERRYDDTRDRLIAVEAAVSGLIREVREYRALAEQRMAEQIASLQRQVDDLRDGGVRRPEFAQLQRVVLVLVLAVVVVYIGRPEVVGRLISGIIG